MLHLQDAEELKCLVRTNKRHRAFQACSLFYTEGGWGILNTASSCV